MPIYPYKCSACGHAADALQKMSADPLTDCPACGKSTYSKQLTAPGFQLKGSGWYVTDFKSGAPAAAPAVATDAAAAATATKTGDAVPAAAPAKTEAAPAATAPAAPASPPAAAPAASSKA